MLQDQNVVSIWGRTDEEALSTFLLYYNKCYCQYYVYILRILDNPISAKRVAKDVFLSLWKMRSEIHTDEAIRSTLFKLADIKCIEEFKELYNTEMNAEETFERLFGKAKDFLQMEKEIAAIVGRLFEEGYFDPTCPQYYKDPTSDYSSMR